MSKFTWSPVSLLRHGSYSRHGFSYFFKFWPQVGELPMGRYFLCRQLLKYDNTPNEKTAQKTIDQVVTERVTFITRTNAVGVYLVKSFL